MKNAHPLDMAAVSSAGADAAGSMYARKECSACPSTDILKGFATAVSAQQGTHAGFTILCSQYLSFPT